MDWIERAFLPVTLVLVITTQAHAPFRMTGADFANGHAFPAVHEAHAFGCHGRNVPLALSWTGAPGRTKSFALTMVDTDAPGGSFVHWVVYGIPASRHSLGPTSLAGLKQGRNSAGLIGYVGPCPPTGSGTHHYHLTLYALSVAVSAAATLELAAVQKAMRHHVLARATLIGTFKRP
jgi:Raf kinase inhibitor-like YbhB/YbcL family protein